MDDDWKQKYEELFEYVDQLLIAVVESEDSMATYQEWCPRIVDLHEKHVPHG